MRRAADEPSPLGLLGIDRTASWEEVRRAFRNAVRASHPDLHGGDPEAERRLKALNAAWESVNTPDRWAAYLRRAAVAPAGRSTRARRSPAAPTFGRLHVRRALRGSAGLRRWMLELDGEVVARIENGGTSILEADAGRHSLRAFYDWYSSPRLDVELRAGQELVLGCRQLEGVRANLFSPKRSLVLERLDSRRFA